jgi:hypothetical protein
MFGNKEVDGTTFELVVNEETAYKKINCKTTVD